MPADLSPPCSRIFVGGETAFYPSNLPGNKHGGTKTAVLVETKAGMALLHKHGDDCMLHEGPTGVTQGCGRVPLLERLLMRMALFVPGRLVQKGVKWVLRSDVMFG